MNELSSAPLRGVRVVELTRGVAGSLPGELLALLGADVIKVEPPGGDPERLQSDGRIDPRFVLSNLNKRSVVADREAPSGRELVEQLLSATDVVIENLQPDGLGSFGISADEAHEANPGLVHLSIIGFDPSSEFAALPVTEASLQCLSGIASVTGEPNEPPQRVGATPVFAATATYGAIGILAALIQRLRTGRGQKVELSMLDAAINLCRTHFSRSAEAGEYERRPGNRQPSAQAEPTGVFPSAGNGPNDFVFAHASPDRMWQRLLHVIGREDLLNDPRFVDGPTRLKHREEVHEVIDAWTSRHSNSEIMRIWGEAGVAVGVTLTTEDLATDDSLLSDGVFAAIDQPGWGRIRVPTLPFYFFRYGVAAPTPVGDLAETAPTLESLGWYRSTDRGLGVDQTSHVEFDQPALRGIRVLDFTHALTGPTATQVLALLGAEVVRVQNADPPSLGIERTWLKLNQLMMNKKSVVLDLKSEEGQTAVEALIPSFDVVMENFGPGTAERLGLAYERLRELNPSIVLGRIKGFGLGSPFRDFLAFNNIAEAMGGSCAITGNPDGEPMLAGPFLGDSGSGLTGALGVLSLLYQRLSTGGHGGVVLTTMQATVATIFSRMAFAEQIRNGLPAMRNGFRELGVFAGPSDVYACNGGGPNDYCYISAIDEAQWRALSKAMNRSDLLNDQRFATPESRYEHREALRREIESWTKDLEKRSVMKVLTTYGVLAAAVMDTAEVMNHPDLQRRGTFVTVLHPIRGEVPHPHWPVRMEQSHVALSPAPQLGEHTKMVLSSVGI